MEENKRKRIPKTDRFADTQWYDLLVVLYKRTKQLGLIDISSQLQNIGWEQMKGIVHGRVHKHIRQRKLLADRDLCHRLFQESFFIYTKALKIWDVERKTKFLTFLGDILDQEIMNIISLEHYHRTRARKLETKLRGQVICEDIKFFDEEDIEKENVLSEVRDLLENFVFKTEIERDIAHTMVYGIIGDWSKLQKKSGLKTNEFSKLRKKVISDLKQYFLEKSSKSVKGFLEEMMKEKEDKMR